MAADVFAINEQPFSFLQKVTWSNGPYIIETVRKILALVTSSLFLLKSGLFVKYDVLTAANTVLFKRA